MMFCVKKRVCEFDNYKGFLIFIIEAFLQYDMLQYCHNINLII